MRTAIIDRDGNVTNVIVLDPDDRDAYVASLDDDVELLPQDDAPGQLLEPGAKRRADGSFARAKRPELDDLPGPPDGR